MSESQDILSMRADVRVHSSQSSFSQGMFDSKESGASWESLAQRIRERLEKTRALNMGDETPSVN